jgi:hypothetical protein
VLVCIHKYCCSVQSPSLGDDDVYTGGDSVAGARKPLMCRIIYYENLLNVFPYCYFSGFSVFSIKSCVSPASTLDEHFCAEDLSVILIAVAQSQRILRQTRYNH